MAYTSLYNKLRPQKFSEVVGQQAVIRVLKNQVQMKMVSHAYLFSGPRGTGKTTLARIFAKAINCENPNDGEACGVCGTCKALSAKNNVDIVEIDAASNTSVNDIRTLRDSVIFTPAVAKYRVYIIDEVHMLSASAFNALLKTLEEPPEHVVFIMATTEPHKLPITVLSRCQKFEFSRIPTSYIAQYLEKISKELNVNADSKALLLIARAAAGGMRDALSLLDQMIAMGDEVIDTKLVSETLGSADRLMYYALCEAILKEDITRALNGLGTMIEKGCSTSTIASDLMQMFRDLYIIQNSNEIKDELILDEISIDRLKSLSSKVSAGSVIKCLEIFSELENELRYAKRPEIWLELAVGKACRVQKEKSYEALLSRIESLEKKIESGVAVESYLPNTKTTPAAPTEPKTQKAPEREEKPETEPIYEPVEEEFFPIRDEDFTGIEAEAYAEYDVPEEAEAYAEYDVPEEVEAKKESAPFEVDETSFESVQEPAPEPVAEGKEAETVDESEGDIAEGKRIWSDTVEIIRKQKIMRLSTPMKKASVAGYNGSTIRLNFQESDETAAKRFENKELKDILTKALKEAAGHPIDFSVSVEKLSEEDSEFMKNIYDVFPDDIVSIE